MIRDSIQDYLIQAPLINANSARKGYCGSGIPKWAYTQDMAKLKVHKDSAEKLTTYRDGNALVDKINNGLGLVIYSNKTKSGKSTLLFNIAMQAVDYGMSGMCFYYSDLLGLFKECLTNSALKMDFKRSVQNVDFICIDNFGIGYVTNNSTYAINELSDMIYYMDSGDMHKTALLVSTTVPFANFTSYMSESAFTHIQNTTDLIELTSMNVGL